MVRLKCTDLTKVYTDGSEGLKSLNLDLDFSGLGLLGRNGSGKTTFINLLLGFITPSYGSFELNVASKDMRIVIDNPALPWKMTIQEWIESLEEMYGSQVLNVDLQTDLDLLGHMKIGNLSTGQQRKVALLPIFYGKPKLIIIDEPSNYLDISTQEYIRKAIKRQAMATGADIIVSSHNIDEIRYFSSDVILLQYGRLMNSIKLGKEEPKYYNILCSSPENLEVMLKQADVKFTRENHVETTTLKVHAEDKFWQVINAFNKNGGSILAIEGVDNLTDMVTRIRK